MPRKAFKLGYRRFARLRQRGVAALEFALTAPMLLVLLMSMYDIANAWLAWRRLTAAAQSVGEIATLLAVNADGSNTLTPDQGWRASTAAYASMPALLAQNARYGVTLSEVLFSAQQGCGGSYCAAYIGWSKGVLGTATPRACGAQTAVPDTAPSGPGVMPQSSFQAAPILVVDITYDYVPLFLGSAVGPIKMARSAYFPARSGNLDQTIAYLDPSVQCPTPGSALPYPGGVRSIALPAGTSRIQPVSALGNQ